MTDTLHRWIPSLVLLLMGGLALLCLLQLFMVETVYQQFRSQMVKSVLSQISTTIEEDGVEAVRPLASDGEIELRVVDSEGKDLIGINSDNSLASYDQEELDALYRQEKLSRGTVWEQVTSFQTPYLQKGGKYQADNCRTLTCANLVEQPDGQKVLVLVRAQVTPSLLTEQVIRRQMMLCFVTVVLLGTGGWFFVRRRRSREIQSMVRTARQMTQGQSGLLFPTNVPSDLKPLSLCLNQAVSYSAQQRKLSQEMMANLSHDLRSPLTTMIGYAEMMRDLPEEATGENMQVLLEEAQRLSLLINDILDLSRRNTIWPEMHLKTFCLTDQLNSIVQNLQKMLSHQGCDIQFEHSCRIWVKADELEISRVVYNLINNALSHIGEDRLVIVEQLVNKNKVYVRVIDHGEGIEEENLSRIWDRYYRTDRAKRCSSPTGSGLGLCIVKTILQQHGATYGVESKLGEGSTFWFALDVLDQEPTQDSAHR